MDKEKISEELKTEVHKYWHKNIKLESKIILTEEQLMEIVGHFYDWYKGNSGIIKSGTAKVTPFSVSKRKRKNIKEGKGPFDDGLAYVRKLTEVMNQKFLEADMPDHPEQAWELGFKTGANCQQEIEAKYREENNICCMKFDYIEEARLAAYEEGKNDMKQQIMKDGQND